jgi:hypothetical protein
MAATLKQDGYPYQPLKSGSSEIRILSLHPGLESDNIRCSLERVSLDANPVFEALSYVWGDATQKREISLDGFSQKVTANLEIALRHLRHLNKPRILWVDALCINQSDLKERSQQVSLMGRVYSSASGVLVSLGKEDRPAESILESIEKGQESEWDFFEASDCFQLLNRPWFRRTWVIQEVVLSQHEPIIGCGRKWIPWSKFAAVPEGLKKHSPVGASLTSLLWCDAPGASLVNSTAYSGLVNFNKISALRCKFRREGSIAENIQLLHNIADFEATDPRDYYYGILGMLPTEERERITPDYTKSFRQVFHEVTSAYISIWFTMVRLFKFHAGTLPQPSWVPDFSKQAARLGPQHHPSHFTLGEETVSGSLKETQVKVQADGLLLEAQGLCLDVIESTLEFSRGLYNFRLPVVRLEQIARAGAKLEITPGDRRSCFAKYRSRHPLSQMFLMNSSEPKKCKSIYEVMGTTGDLRGMERTLAHELSSHWEDSVFFRTQIGLCGTAVAGVREGDIVAILLGGSSTFILRPKDDYYVFIGQSCVSGIMDGQLIDELVAEGKLDSMLESFNIR